MKSTRKASRLGISACMAAGMLLGFGLVADGQQVGVSTPFQSFGDSFYESAGVNFGFTLPGGRGPGSRVVGYAGNGVLTPNLRFQQGGAASAVPPFGGYDPNANANFGFGRYNSNGGGFSLGLSLGKGSTRTLTSTTPSMVVQNGFGGSMFSGQVSPFVTGYYPVVGGGRPLMMGGGRPPVMDNAVTRAVRSGQLDLTSPGVAESAPSSVAGVGPTRESSAPYGDESVAAIKARRQARLTANESHIEALIRKGLDSEEEGDYLAARKVYREAIKICDDRKRLKWLRERVAWTKDR